MPPQLEDSVSTPRPESGPIDPFGIYSVISALPVRQPLGTQAVEKNMHYPPSLEAMSDCSDNSSESSSPSTVDGKSIFSAKTSETQATTISSVSAFTQSSMQSGGMITSVSNQSSGGEYIPTTAELDSQYSEADEVQPLTEEARVPCEFARFAQGGWKCDATFALDDIEGLIDHVAKEHFEYNYPPKAICWFCDGEEAKFFTDSMKQEDRERNFYRRMRHIVQHYQDTNWERLRQRPDFWVTNFLVDHGLLNPSVRTESESWSEVQKPRWWQDEPQKAPSVERRERGQAITNQTCRGRKERKAVVYHR